MRSAWRSTALHCRFPSAMHVGDREFGLVVRIVEALGEDVFVHPEPHGDVGAFGIDEDGVVLAFAPGDPPHHVLLGKGRRDARS